MRRTEVLQEVRPMKFEELCSRRRARRLTQEQAAEILGVSVRTVRRWEDRYDASGAEGLYDGRLGKLAGSRVPTDRVMEMLTLFDTKFRDFTPKHFHEKLVASHGFTQSYNKSPAASGRRNTPQPTAAPQATCCFWTITATTPKSPYRSRS